MNTPRLMPQITLLFATLISACTTTQPPIATAAQVDLPRFMGDWYVIASIPTFIEREAYNAVESYRLDPDGTIATTFTFNKGGFDGKAKRYEPRGFVFDKQTNATWGMRFVWPIKADFRIVYVDANYAHTIIGRQARDYAWIMARQPIIDEATYQSLVKVLQEQGYDVSQLRKVPQQPR